MTLAQVVDKASSEHYKALLVYANETATTVPRIPLSAPLVEFIKRDNIVFLEELQTSMAGYDMGTSGQVQGRWDHQISDMNTWDTGDFNEMSAKQYFEQANTSEQSSTTLTPNTDMDDDSVAMEMEEVKSANTVWPGAVSNASSDTVGGEVVGIVEPERQGGGASVRDVEMTDVELGDADEDEDARPKAQHIENVDRKGG